MLYDENLTPIFFKLGSFFCKKYGLTQILTQFFWCYFSLIRVEFVVKYSFEE